MYNDAGNTPHASEPRESYMYLPHLYVLGGQNEIVHINGELLYPTAMLYKLPVGGYKFIAIGDKDQQWIADIDFYENENYIPKDNMPARAQGDIRFITEIDFHYHEEIHKINNDWS